jgi:hypothetical protein
MTDHLGNPPETCRGILLSREPTGERFWKLTLLCEEHGILWCLLRVPSKPGSEATPDLFDTAEVRLNAPKGSGASFVSEYRVEERITALGADYTRLEIACRWARLLIQNPPPPDSAPAVFALCKQALEAFAKRPRPDATLFKSLWKLARDGGWPVFEHWLAGLPAPERERARTALRQPLDAQDAPPAVLARLTRDLENWLTRECHFIFQPANS